MIAGTFSQIFILCPRTAVALRRAMQSANVDAVDTVPFNATQVAADFQNELSELQTVESQDGQLESAPTDQLVRSLARAFSSAKIGLVVGEKNDY